ncbi:ABC transporter ATP-binding protein [Streptomyces californicus]|uniref:ABC transporter ATP-binding protein n=1 Tax=Streptomyces TaxID=1883 RepID=UPI000BF12BE6|nr:ABC transporter ATP-binding protein [Streptomyces sp. sk226]
MTSAPPAAAPPVLALDGLTRRYGTLTAVDGVSLRLVPGARHAVIGPNGAGKTTLLNLIAGTDRPDGGAIALEGADITRRGTAARSRLGIARSFQQPSVVTELSVLDNVVLAGWTHRPRHRGAWRRPSLHRSRQETAVRHLEAVGLADLAHRPAGVLSHGQRRMLDLAAALAGDPRLLLLDEPAAGLTDAGIDRLLGIVGGLPPAVAVILVEHHVEVVAHLATDTTVLAAGQVIATGPTREVLARPDVRAAYHGSASAAVPGASGPSDGPGAGHVPTVCPSPTDARG